MSDVQKLIDASRFKGSPSKKKRERRRLARNDRILKRDPLFQEIMAKQSPDVSASRNIGILK